MIPPLESGRARAPPQGAASSGPTAFDSAGVPGPRSAAAPGGRGLDRVAVESCEHGWLRGVGAASEEDAGAGGCGAGAGGGCRVEGGDRTDGGCVGRSTACADVEGRSGALGDELGAAGGDGGVDLGASKGTLLGPGAARASSAPFPLACASPASSSSRSPSGSSSPGPLFPASAPLSLLSLSDPALQPALVQGLCTAGCRPSVAERAADLVLARERAEAAKRRDPGQARPDPRAARATLEEQRIGPVRLPSREGSNDEGTCPPSRGGSNDDEGTCPPSRGRSNDDEGTCPPSRGRSNDDEGTCPPSRARSNDDEGTCPPSRGRSNDDEGTCPPSKDRWGKRGTVCSSSSGCFAADASSLSSPTPPPLYPSLARLLPPAARLAASLEGRARRGGPAAVAARRRELAAGARLALELASRRRAVAILLAGTSGTGKSTLASLLAARLGFSAALSTDSVRAALRSFADPETDPILFASTYDAGGALGDRAGGGEGGDGKGDRGEERQSGGAGDGGGDGEATPRPLLASARARRLRAGTLARRAAQRAAQRARPPFDAARTSQERPLPKAQEAHELPFHGAAGQSSPERSAQRVSSPAPASFAAPSPASSPPSPLSDLDPRTLEGYRVQRSRVLPRVEALVLSALRRGQSIVVEGVHLSPVRAADLVERARRQWAQAEQGGGGGAGDGRDPFADRGAVVGRCTQRPGTGDAGARARASSSSPGRSSSLLPPLILPVVLHIRSPARHAERFSVRAKSGSLRARDNRYVRHLAAIRAIQALLLEEAHRAGCPTLHNANVDRTLAVVHGALLRIVGAEQMSKVDHETGEREETRGLQAATEREETRGLQAATEREETRGLQAAREREETRGLQAAREREETRGWQAATEREETRGWQAATEREELENSTSVEDPTASVRLPASLARATAEAAAAAWSKRGALAAIRERNAAGRRGHEDPREAGGGGREGDDDRLAERAPGRPGEREARTRTADGRVDDARAQAGMGTPRPAGTPRPTPPPALAAPSPLAAAPAAEREGDGVETRQRRREQPRREQRRAHRHDAARRKNEEMATLNASPKAPAPTPAPGREPLDRFPPSRGATSAPSPTPPGPHPPEPAPPGSSLFQAVATRSSPALPSPLAGLPSDGSLPFTNGPTDGSRSNVAAASSGPTSPPAGRSPSGAPDTPQPSDEGRGGARRACAGCRAAATGDASLARREAGSSGGSGSPLATAAALASAARGLLAAVAAAAVRRSPLAFARARSEVPQREERSHGDDGADDVIDREVSCAAAERRVCSKGQIRSSSKGGDTDAQRAERGGREDILRTGRSADPERDSSGSPSADSAPPVNFESLSELPAAGVFPAIPTGFPAVPPPCSDARSVARGEERISSPPPAAPRSPPAPRRAPRPGSASPQSAGEVDPRAAAAGGDAGVGIGRTPVGADDARRSAEATPDAADDARTADEATKPRNGNTLPACDATSPSHLSAAFASHLNAVSFAPTAHVPCLRAPFLPEACPLRASPSRAHRSAPSLSAVARVPAAATAGACPALRPLAPALCRWHRPLSPWSDPGHDASCSSAEEGSHGCSWTASGAASAEHSWLEEPWLAQGPEHSPRDRHDGTNRWCADRADANERGCADRADANERGCADRADANERGCADRADANERGCADRGGDEARIVGTSWPSVDPDRGGSRALWSSPALDQSALEVGRERSTYALAAPASARRSCGVASPSRRGEEGEVKGDVFGASPRRRSPAFSGPGISSTDEDACPSLHSDDWLPLGAFGRARRRSPASGGAAPAPLRGTSRGAVAEAAPEAPLEAATVPPFLEPSFGAASDAPLLQAAPGSAAAAAPFGVALPLCSRRLTLMAAPCTFVPRAPHARAPSSSECLGPPSPPAGDDHPLRLGDSPAP